MSVHMWCFLLYEVQCTSILHSISIFIRTTLPYTWLFCGTVLLRNHIKTLAVLEKNKNKKNNSNTQNNILFHKLEISLLPQLLHVKCFSYMEQNEWYLKWYDTEFNQYYPALHISIFVTLQLHCCVFLMQINIQNEWQLLGLWQMSLYSHCPQQCDIFDVALQVCNMSLLSCTV